MFEKLISDIDFEVTRRIFKVEVQAHTQNESKPAAPVIYKSAGVIDPFKQESQKQLSQPVQTVQTPPIGQNVDSHQNQNAGFKIIPPGTSQKKPGRNEPCWCGSGKKYKRCHWPD